MSYIEKKGKIFWKSELSWESEREPGISVSQFEKLNENYGRCDNRVWFQQYLIESDTPNKFEALGIEHARDLNHAYHQSIIINGADAKTFQSLQSGFGRDINRVFWKTRTVEGADPLTFKVLSINYAKDHKTVYDLIRVLEGADPETFAVLNDEFAKDCNNVWENGQRRLDLVPDFEIPHAKQDNLTGTITNLIKSVKKGEAKAAVDIGNIYGNDGDEFMAFLWFSVASDLGDKESRELIKDLRDEFEYGEDSVADLELARWYHNGESVSQNFELAKKYLQRSLKKGLLKTVQITRSDLIEEMPWADELFK